MDVRPRFLFFWWSWDRTQVAPSSARLWIATRQRAFLFPLFANAVQVEGLTRLFPGKRRGPRGEALDRYLSPGPKIGRPDMDSFETQDVAHPSEREAQDSQKAGYPGEEKKRRCRQSLFVARPAPFIHLHPSWPPHALPPLPLDIPTPSLAAGSFRTRFVTLPGSTSALSCRRASAVAR